MRSAVGLAATTALVAGAATPAAHANVRGTVQYLARRCYADSARSKAPLRGAQLRLQRRTGLPVTVALDEHGDFRARRVPGRGPITATAILTDAHVFVTPSGSHGVPTAPYELRLGTLPRGRAKLLLRGNGPAGAANIFSVLHAGARLAARSAPVPLGRIPVVWRYSQDFSQHRDQGAFGNSVYDSDLQRLYVDGTKTRQDQWEPFVLLHEYGHRVLSRVADPGRDASGDHDWRLSYPTRPSLAWNEGFANAFAAIALDDPDLSILCGRDAKDHMNVGLEPATPEPKQPRYAMSNETADAGVVWHLARHLGHGHAQRGLRPLLGALHRFRRNGHAAHDMRDVRDAIIDGGLERQDPTEHAAIDRIFAGQGIGFGTAIELDVPYSDPYDEWVRISIKGPYGCTQDNSSDFKPLAGADGGTWMGGEVVDGGLPYTWQDECLGGRWMLFPYLPRSGHRDTYTVSVTYHCDPGYHETSPGSSVYNNCFDQDIDVELARSVWTARFWPSIFPGRPKTPGGGDGHISDLQSANRLAGGPDGAMSGFTPDAGVFLERVTLAHGETKQVAIFGAAGEFCRMLQTQEDCGV